MSIKNNLIYFLLFTFAMVSCEKEEKLMEDKQLQKEWELISFYDKELGKIIEYPEDIDKIWIHFTEDSVFLHGFCPTVGGEYQIQKNSSLLVNGLIIQEYCGDPYDFPAWNHEVVYILARNTNYQVTGNELAIFSEWRFDMYLTEKKD